jgi:DNA-binding NtrC family response regulator
MKDSIKILFVEDILADAEMIWHEITRNNISFEKKLVDNRNDYISALKSFEPELIISDYSLPQFDGMSALLLKNELAPTVPFILVTGSINEEIAVDLMKSGADDYVIKQNLSRLGSAIKSAIKKWEVFREKEAALKQKIEELERFNELSVGRELKMVELKKEVNMLLKRLGEKEKYKIVE